MMSMKQSAKDPVTAPEALKILYAPIRDDLDRVEEILQEELRSDYPFVDRLARHGFRIGGKRLRPALLLLSAKASGGLRAEHRVLAAAVEMIHTATLIHDDVLDEATIRRHADTVNARWDNETSILLGDYLFTRAVCMASAVDGSFACRTIGEASRTMCEGELRQVGARGDYDLSEEEYLDIIAEKTAALTACCCRLGSHYAGAGAEVREAMTRFGRDVGIAFQIADDVLDMLGDESSTGKSLGTDLAKGKPTLPLIHLLGLLSGDDRRQVISILTGSGNHHAEALRPWLERHDAVGYAQRKAAWYTQRAGEELDALPSNPTRDLLQGLTHFVVERQQ